MKIIERFDLNNVNYFEKHKNPELLRITQQNRMLSKPMSLKPMATFQIDNDLFP